MNPFALLAADHARQLELAGHLTGGRGDPPGSPKEQHRLAQQLVMVASGHEAVEEQFFWPVVRDRLEGGAALAGAAVRQEMGARSLLHELHRTSPGDDKFMTLVLTAASHIRDHITYEEGQVWPALQLALDAEDQERLGDRLAAARRTAPTRPHPHAPPGAGLLRTVGPLTGAVDRVLDRITRRGR